MKKRRLKRSVIAFIYAVLAVGFCFSLYYIEKGFDQQQDNITYVNKVILEDEKPVVATSKTIIRPYSSSNIQVLRSYYDIQSDEANQENAIIYYNGTYIQNTGVIYGQDEQFDIIAIMDGEVIKVEDSTLLGKVVEIKHTNEIISTYQLLGETNVNVGDVVKQGDKIGVSSISNIVNNNKHKLYFELAIRGQLVNSEQYYDKKLEEI